MRIQVISTRREIKQSESYSLVFSSINSPAAFDAHDLNIIDLQSNELWKNRSNSISTIDNINDFITLESLIKNAKKSKTIICFPQNHVFNYDSKGTGYYYSKKLKDMIPDVIKIIQYMLPDTVYNTYVLSFEQSTTKCKNEQYNASFYFWSGCSKYKTLTKNDGAEHTTTLAVSDNLIFTTLNVFESAGGLKCFLAEIGLDKDQIVVPEWIEDYQFFNDLEQKETIRKAEEKIAQENKIINKARDDLSQNLFYKRILFETGNPLVESVFKMLEQMVQCDLSDFKDEKNEDFRIVLPDVTFIGEIKGINTNVKSSNVSQLDTHCAEYSDKLDEEGKTENIKGLLIINTERNKSPSEREAIPQKQLDSAVRNKSLIVKTEVFLRLFELFLLDKISTEKIVQLFKDKIGALEETDFIV